MSKLWVYDIETIINCITFCATNAETDETVQFVMHESRDDSQALYEFLCDLRDNRGGLIGFNNRGFDWPVLSEFVDAYMRNVRGSNLITSTYYSAQSIIGTQSNGMFGGRRFFDEWVPQLDLFLIHHFNNAARATSLKAVQVAIKWPNVMDNLFPHDVPVSEAEIPHLLEYNMNDVAATKELYKRSANKIELRKKLGVKFPKLKKKFMNSSDVGIGEDIFLFYLSKAMGISIRDLKQLKTRKSNVHLKDIIFPHIKFETPEFLSIYNKMMNTVVGPDEIESALKQIEGLKDAEEILEVLAQKELGVKKVAKSKKKKGFSYTTRWGDFWFYYGIGGIHGCITPGKYTSDENYILIDSDVKSFYPNIAIRDNLHPRHLNKQSFVSTYERIFDDRVAAQGANDKVMSDGLKLSLNGVFGKSGFDKSVFYDPHFFCGITINGQLLLSMFAERVLTSGVDAQILQINTDGVTFRIARKDLDKYSEIASQWEADTKMWLEHAHYDMMAIRDVNNYIAMYTDGKVKLKGDFEVEKEFHKDNSFNVVAIAARDYFCYGKPVLDTLKEHEDIYDFCGRYKGTKKFSVQFVYLGKDDKGLPCEMRDEYGKIYRYLPVIKGGTSIKVDAETGKITNLLAGRPTEAFSKYHDFDKRLLDYNFFIWKTQELINSVTHPQTDLLR